MYEYVYYHKVYVQNKFSILYAIGNCGSVHGLLSVRHGRELDTDRFR